MPLVDPHTRDLYQRLLSYLRPYWRIFALAILAMAILAGAEAGFPVLLGPTFDGTFVQKDIGYETRRGDNSRPWLIAGTLLAILAAFAALVINRRLP